jgi:hypothetical protein
MSINRSAEAMTIFAVICAALVSRYFTWGVFGWLIGYFPLPNQFGSLVGKLQLTTALGRIRDLNLLLGITWCSGTLGLDS